MPVRWQSPLFEGVHGKFVLGMVAGPRREFDVAQLLQFAPHCGRIERHRKFVVKPLDQIDEPLIQTSIALGIARVSEIPRRLV